jgi:hypothetical protein
LKIFFEQTVDTWQKSHPGRHITQYDIGELFAKAYFRSASVENSVNGFLKTGIRHCDINVFTDADFAAAEVSERSEAPTETPEQLPSVSSNPAYGGADAVRQSENLEQDPATNHPVLQPVRPTYSADDVSPLNQSHQSGDALSEQVILEVEGVDYSIPVTPADITDGRVPASAVSPADIRPYPKKQRALFERRKRNKQQAEILTSTPFKNALIEKKKSKATAQHHSKERVKRKLTLKGQDAPKIRKKRSTSQQLNGTDEDTTPCYTCKQRFCDDKSGMNWIQCQKCEAWFHNACQGLSQKGQYSFTCIECDDTE